MSIKLESTDISKIFLGDAEIEKVYLGSQLVFSSGVQNILLNGTFDDDSDTSYTPEFNVTGGVVVYTHNLGSSVFTWDLAEELVAGQSYNFTMDILNLISGNARFRFFVNQGGSDVEVLGNTNYNSGVNVDFTAPVGVNSTQLKIITSSAASSFDFDNAVLIAN